MSIHSDFEERSQPPACDDARERLLAGTPVTGRQMELAGVSTAVLEGVGGAPVILLHGQGGFAAQWMTVIPGLASTPSVRAANRRLLRELGTREIPPE
jgi:hypothetical protein